ncbi:MAG: 50S ribosomal protein L21 [Clostridia bacterium]|nr:50S ribosomal protein L21 [Clostridia bacterium]
MFAIVETGGKQYKVSQGDVIRVEKLELDVNSNVNLKTLMVCDGEKVLAGNDVQNVTVTAQVMEHGKEKKVVVIKYRAKKHSGTKNGHRQPYTLLKIVSIN